ncbi:MAG: hypothetical protein ACK5LP_10365 [Campylobacteraceae bacterium]
MKTYAQIFSELLEISEKSFYRWKNKDHKKLISLLEKYFTKEDIQEFIRYGTIEKFEFLNAQPYLYDESEFTSILITLKETGGDWNHIDYLAFALSDDDCEEYLETKKDFLSIYIFAYDKYKNYYTSDALGIAVAQLNLHFQTKELNHNTFTYFINKDFLPFVKACVFYQPQYANLAIEFCIRYNLYKYKNSSVFEDIYKKFMISNSEYHTVEEKFNFEDFKNEIRKLQS